MIELSKTAFEKSQGHKQKIQLVLEIEGAPKVFGIGQIKSLAKIGDENLYINDIGDNYEDWTIGGLIPIINQSDAITMEGTTNTISQQISIDKGGYSSISSMNISLLDINGEITDLITPDKILPEILGRKATIYLGYQETAWPQDFVQIFNGIIDSVSAGPTIILSISHPEARKKGQFFEPIDTVLTQPAKFRSAEIQNVIYKTRKDVVGQVYVTYLSGGTAGSESISITGNNIYITIQVNATKAKNIRDVIESSTQAMALVDVEIKEDENGDSLAESLQIAQASTLLGTDTTLHVASTQGMLLPVPSEGFRTFVRIEDEIIEYTGLTATTITGCTRQAMKNRDSGTYGVHHEAESEVKTLIVIEGNSIDLALKLQLSGDEEYFLKDYPVSYFGVTGDNQVINNIVFFANVNLDDKAGLVPGDKIKIEDLDNPANNFTGTIERLVVTQEGSYVSINKVYPVITMTTAKASFGSKYNVWPDGMYMGGDQIDVPAFETIKDRFASSILDQSLIIDDQVNGRSFIDDTILFTTGALSIPRKGKTSCSYSSPPIASGELKKIDSSNTIKPAGNRITRSINSNFYNNVVFKYGKLILEDRYLAGEVFIDSDSFARTGKVKRTLTIEGKGILDTPENKEKINILCERLLDRFKKGAEEISVKTFFGTSFNMDIADSVLFGDADMNLPDTKRGTREFSPRIMEVRNKKTSISSGENELTLIDTGYALSDASFGVVSPSSKVGVGSTTTTVKVENSFEFNLFREKYKWEPYFNRKILIHSEDFTRQEEAVLLGFDAADDYRMVLASPLSFVPQAGDIVDICNYDEDASIFDLYKKAFVYTNPSIKIESGLSGSVFDVSPADIDKLIVGASVQLRSDDYSSMSKVLKIASISGETVTLSGDAGFTPDSTCYVEMVGFVDSGAPYLYL